MKTSIAWFSLTLMCLVLSARGQDAERPSAVRAAASLQESKTSVHDFEGDETGKVPKGFVTARTGGGGEGKWVVRDVSDAPSGRSVVAQLSDDRTNRRFPLLIDDRFVAGDVDLSVRFKPISGEVDQAAGLVWRYVDKNNYYVVRANALENNVVFYKVDKGRRSSLGIKSDPSSYGVDAIVELAKWSSLRVVAKGSTFEIHLNGKKLFESEDGTFTKPGKIGLWTKADSVTYFDDLKAARLDRSPQ